MTESGEHHEILTAKPKPCLGERLIFETRWLLFPMYLGLCVALVVYIAKFMALVYDMIVHFNTLGENMMPQVLGLVDIIMVGNLIQMITLGSHAIFIRKFDIPSKNKPQWLDHINAGTLKVKMGGSLVGVSSIHLLQDFMNASEHDWNTILKRVVIHVMFVVSTLGLAWADQIIHPPETN